MDNSIADDFTVDDLEYVNDVERQMLRERITELRLQQNRLFAEESRLTNLLRRLGATTTTTT